VGRAFWRFHALLMEDKKAPKLENPDDTALALLIFWLGYNRASRLEQRGFDNSHYLAEELLLVDDLETLFEGTGNNDLSDGTPHSAIIAEAFREVTLFDALFCRGDANQDLHVDLSDAVHILEFLFGGKGPFHDCPNGLDSDNNGAVELTDALRILLHLFGGWAPPEEPFLECGVDPELPGHPGNLGCRDSACQVRRDFPDPDLRHEH